MLWGMAFSFPAFFWGGGGRGRRRGTAASPNFVDYVIESDRMFLSSRRFLNIALGRFGANNRVASVISA